MEIIFTLFVSLVEDNVTMIECFLHYTIWVTLSYYTRSIARRANRLSTARKKRTAVRYLVRVIGPRLQVVQTTDMISSIVHYVLHCFGASISCYERTVRYVRTYIRRALSLIRLSYVRGRTGQHVR